MGKLDILNREEFVNKLVTLTENLSETNSNTSFALNGVWGCGKSFVLDMYEERLNIIQNPDPNKVRNKYFVIRYNCWKYDYYDEPLVAIVADIIETIETKTKLFPDTEKKQKILGTLKAIGISLLTISNGAIKEKSGVDLEKAFNVVKSGLSDGAKKYEKKHDYDAYFGFNTAMAMLSKSLEEISMDYTIVFLVDELDRCLPEYAIKVLERLHHLSEYTNNVITVMAIDKNQLEQSVKTLFGFENPDTYLKKFISFEIFLDNGKISDKFIEKYADYINLFDNSVIEYDDSIEEFMQAVFQKIDIREQEQLMKRAMLAHKMLFDDKKDYSFMCVELLYIILFTHYQGRVNFTDWFKTYNRTTEASKEWPPFDFYFKDKFDSLPCKEFVTEGYNPHKICYINAEQSLYASIAYTWYSIFMKSNSSYLLQIENADIRSILDDNAVELKKYIEFIKFII